MENVVLCINMVQVRFTRLQFIGCECCSFVRCICVQSLRAHWKSLLKFCTQNACYCPQILVHLPIKRVSYSIWCSMRICIWAFVCLLWGTVSEEHWFHPIYWGQNISAILFNMSCYLMISLILSRIAFFYVRMNYLIECLIKFYLYDLMSLENFAYNERFSL